MPRSGRILVVDDDRAFRMLVAEGLERDGHEVLTCSGGEQALRMLWAERIDLLLADLKMAGMSGMDLLARVRDMPLDIEIIVMTAYGSKESAIGALRCRVFDYLEKPFSLERLRGSVQRALQARLPRALRHGTCSYRDLVIDADAHRLWVRGVEVELTRAEFDVLAYLFMREGCAVSPEELLAHAWGKDPSRAPDPMAVKSCIYRLRKKIGDNARHPRYIRNVRGIGYQLGGTD